MLPVVEEKLLPWLPSLIWGDLSALELLVPSLEPQRHQQAWDLDYIRSQQEKESESTWSDGGRV